MEIIAFVLGVEATLCLGAFGALGYLVRVHPLHSWRGGLEPDAARARRGAWLALGLWALVAGYATFVVVQLHRENVAAGEVLPKPYHPRGWRYEWTEERLWRQLQGIYDDRSLTASERAAFDAEREAALRRNAVHDRAEQAATLYVLLPLGGLGLLCVLLGGDLRRQQRGLAAVLLAAYCTLGWGVARLGVYTALCGD